RINTPFIKAWRIVNKALSRKSIEVTNRNQEKKIFTVLYDPDEQELKDYTYWNQISSLFSGAHNNEKIYSIQLEEKNRQTDIVITDKDLKPLSDETSNKLLTLLEESIRADLATK
ncbi:MAG: outer membrane protein assembly factor BamC, partial [Methylococcaceae bacterium]